MAIQYKFCILTLLSANLYFTGNLQAEPLPPPAPPEEAVQACTSLKEGEQCSFTHPQGTFEGICINLDTNLACGFEDGFAPLPAAHFDVTEAVLKLPITSVDDTAYFRVSLQLVSSNPILLNLTEATEIEQAEQAIATYTGKTGILEVPQFSFDSKLYSLSLKLVSSEPSYQFELVSMKELE